MSSLSTYKHKPITFLLSELSKTITQLQSVKVDKEII